jgi:DNA-directed RNA polymerase subunit RPC12/RpoP
MSGSEIELHCECARCGKSDYHTVRWLRENTSVKCPGCSNTMLSSEVLRINTKLVQESDNAAHR